MQVWPEKAISKSSAADPWGSPHRLPPKNHNSNVNTRLIRTELVTGKYKRKFR